MFTAELEGLDEFQHQIVWAHAQLRVDIANANMSAAVEGVRNVKGSHPYTDRTGQLTSTSNAQAVRVPGAGIAQDLAEMRWPKFYAGFVNEKERFNFTKEAEERAAVVLEYGTEVALERFAAKLSG